MHPQTPGLVCMQADEDPRMIGFHCGDILLHFLTTLHRYWSRCVSKSPWYVFVTIKHLLLWKRLKCKVIFLTRIAVLHCCSFTQETKKYRKSSNMRKITQSLDSVYWINDLQNTQNAKAYDPSPGKNPHRMCISWSFMLKGCFHNYPWGEFLFFPYRKVRW